MIRLRAAAFASLVAALGAAGPAAAGPPFTTDDPFVFPRHTGEAYLFAAGTHADDGTTLDAAPGVEANYSFFDDTFMHLVVPLAHNLPQSGSAASGLGDIEIGLKWQFVRETDTAPAVAVFPLVEAPTGDADRGLGNGQTQYFLPLWLGKSWGAWTAYGGAGYWINNGPGNRNWWLSGIVLQRQLSDRLYLGGEIFHQTADTDDGHAATGFSLGGGYTVADPYQILFSVGRNVQNPERNRISFYVALYRTF